MGYKSRLDTTAGDAIRLLLFVLVLEDTSSMRFVDLYRDEGIMVHSYWLKPL